MNFLCGWETRRKGPPDAALEQARRGMRRQPLHPQEVYAITRRAILAAGAQRVRMGRQHLRVSPAGQRRHLMGRELARVWGDVDAMIEILRPHDNTWSHWAREALRDAHIYECPACGAWQAAENVCADCMSTQEAEEALEEAAAEEEEEEEVVG